MRARPITDPTIAPMNVTTSAAHTGSAATPAATNATMANGVAMSQTPSRITIPA